jgi:hypothetical protein
MSNKNIGSLNQTIPPKRAESSIKTSADQDLSASGKPPAWNFACQSRLKIWGSQVWWPRCVADLKEHATDSRNG